jgi:hypothetical protein
MPSVKRTAASRRLGGGGIQSSIQSFSWLSQFSTEVFLDTVFVYCPLKIEQFQAISRKHQNTRRGSIDAGLIDSETSGNFRKKHQRRV